MTIALIDAENLRSRTATDLVAPGRENAAVHPFHPELGIQPDKASTVVRRFSGPVADELFLLCRPGDLRADAARQAACVYEALVALLGSEGAGPEAIVSETVFFRDIRADRQDVCAARERVFGGPVTGPASPATTLIGQRPLSDDARIEVAVIAVLPHRGVAWSAREAAIRTAACPCDACSRGVRGRVVRLGDQVSLHAGNICGSWRGGAAEAYELFCVAERLLAEAGMSFADVARTWIHLRDIDRDYDALNQARREFFEQRGIERRPASTGVQGIPFPDAHDFSMSFHAVKSTRPLDRTLMSTPTLNEAWTYGADFSRGLRLTDANQVTLYVSGTASIDEAGRSVHTGDFAAQAARMLLNIETLLAAQGAGFEHLMSAVTYLKNPADAPVLRRMFRERGFQGFPSAIVEAPLCRPELLCEAEAVAVLPLANAGA